MAAPHPALALPELIMDECPACQGDGFRDHGHDEEGEPRECDECGGTGEVEVCCGCGQRPDVKDGLEVCGCVRTPDDLELPHIFQDRNGADRCSSCLGPFSVKGGYNTCTCGILAKIAGEAA